MLFAFFNFFTCLAYIFNFSMEIRRDMAVSEKKVCANNFVEVMKN